MPLTPEQQARFVDFVNKHGISGERYDFAFTVYKLACAQPELPISTPHTHGAFRSTYWAEHNRWPTGQEVFDAGMRAGRDLKWPEHSIPAQTGIDQQAPSGRRKILMPTGMIDVTPEPVASPPGSAGSGERPTFRDWWATPNAETCAAPRNFMDENSARAAWFAALSQPVQAAPDKFAGINQHHVADAFWESWEQNGVPYKHGYYESTWIALRAAIRAAATPGDPSQ